MYPRRDPIGIARYLPSRHFSLLAGALALSAGLIGAAWWTVSSASDESAQLVSANPPSALADQQWRTEFSSSTAMERAASLQMQAQKLIEEASTSKLTDTLGRSILINLAAAQGQGLGPDDMTQGRIVNDALSRVQAISQPKSYYSVADANIVEDSRTSMHDFANTLATVAGHPIYADKYYVVYVVGTAIDTNSDAILKNLPAASAEYRAIAKNIMALPIPRSFAALAVQMANADMNLAVACDLLQQVHADPASGLAGLQEYSNLSDASIPLYSNVSKTLNRFGVTFAKGEPGNGWDTFRAEDERTAAARAKAAADAVQEAQQGSQ